MTRLGKSRYEVMKMIGKGELEGVPVDEHFAVRADSIERYEAALSA
jgi:hypothetical protein